MATKTNISISKRLAPFVESAPFFYDLRIEPGVILKRLTINLLGTITFSAGTTSGVSTGENPGNLIQKVELDGNPTSGGRYAGGKLVNLTPRAALRQRIFDRGYFQDDVSLGAAGVVGAAAGYILASQFPIEFSLPQLGSAKSASDGSPDDTAIRLDQFDSLTLKITTGTVVGMLVGNDRALALNSVYMEIVEEREYAPGFWPKGTMYQDDRLVPITGGANARFAIDSVLPQNDAYISALLIAETTGKVLTDTIINSVEIKSGTDSIRKLDKFEIKLQQRDFVTDYAQSMAGLHYFEFCRGGRLSNAMRALGFTVDLANPGTDSINVVTRRLQLPVAALPATK